MNQTLLLFITTAALACAGVMAALAWRLAHEEQRRSAARIGALAADIHGVGQDAPAPVASQSGARTIAGVVFGVTTVGAIAAIAILLGGSAQAPSLSQGRDGTTASGGRPLELTALAHERDHGQLTVRGIVRNPRGAPAADRVMAVVSAYDLRGAVSATGRAPVQRAILAGGTESTFMVTLPDAGNVTRYRVSFTADDRIVPHVDRRSRGETERTR